MDEAAGAVDGYKFQNQSKKLRGEDGKVVRVDGKAQTDPTSGAAVYAAQRDAIMAEQDRQKQDTKKRKATEDPET